MYEQSDEGGCAATSSRAKISLLLSMQGLAQNSNFKVIQITNLNIILQFGAKNNSFKTSFTKTKFTIKS